MIDQALPTPDRPSDSVTPERVAGFMRNLNKRVSSVSVSMMLGSLARMLVAIEPQHDWDWLKDTYQTLKLHAAPSRDKRSVMRSASEIYQLGLCLMREAETLPLYPELRARRYRDGLLIAFLITHCLRIANLSSIRLNQHIFQLDGAYRLSFSEAETKNGRAIAEPLQDCLVDHLDRYLGSYRPFLLAKAPAPTMALWINKYGRPMKDAAIRQQIKDQTKAAFGHAIWPHLFRDIAATSTAIEIPEQMEIIPDLLGHATLRTAEKHYIQARSVKASREVGKAIRRVRVTPVPRSTSLY
jgi:integrase